MKRTGAPVVRQALARAFMWLGLALCQPVTADHWVVGQQWQATDGLPLDTALALAMDGEGRLWMATNDGVARFDGFDFTHFNTESSPSLTSNRAIAIFNLEGEGVIVQFEDGAFGHLEDNGYTRIAETGQWNLHVDGDMVFFLDAGKLSRWRARSGVALLDSRPATVLRAGAEQGHWLLGTEDGQVFSHAADSGHTRQIVDNLGEQVTGIGAGDGGRLAVATLTTLYEFRDSGHATTLLARIELPRRQWSPLRIFRASGHWVIDRFRWDDQPARLVRFDGEKLRLPEQNAPPGARYFSPVTPVRRDHKGQVWSNSGYQLRIDGQVVFESQYLVHDFLIDRNDQVWLATYQGGLQLLTRPVLETLGSKPGQLADPNVYLVTDLASALYVGGFAGLDRLDLDSGGWTRLWDGAARSLVADGDALLVGGHGLCRLTTPGECRRMAFPGQPASMVELLHRDRAGALWAGTDTGLHRRAPAGHWQAALIAGTPVRAVLELDDGELLFGTRRGVYSVRAGDGAAPPQKLVDRGTGLTSDHVRDLFAVDRRHILIGLEDRGICLYRRAGGVTRCISTADGLPHHSVHKMIADNSGNLWVNTNNGIYSVPIDQLMAYLNEAGDPPRFRRFGVRDGMVSSEGNGGVAQAGTRTPDGRIWFPSQRGVVIVDPPQVDTTDQPIAAIIHVLGQPPGQTIELPPERRMLRLRLGAVAPGRARDVEFRYRLNHTPYWTEIGHQTELTFDQLAPGDYRLEAGARLAGGDWLGETARLEFRVPPRLTEHAGFRLAVVVGAMLALIGLLWRERAHAARLEERVDARTAELRQAMHTVEHQAIEIKSTARRRDELFLAVGHELRTPLTLILGPLANPRTPPGPEQLERMRRSAEQMHRMIEQILAYERIDLEAGAPRRTQPLAALVRRAMESYRPTADERGIDLRFHVEPHEDAKSLFVSVDTSRMEQAIGIVIGNAVKFAPAGGKVAVTLETDADSRSLALHVEDNGPGIAPEIRDKVFEPFARDDRHPRAGLGLGLPICWKIINGHDGSIHIDQSDLGGARIRISLPAQTAPDAEAQRAGKDRQTVLVVDDNRDIRAWVRDILGERFRVLEAGDGDEGERMARTELPDVLLADISMPVANGIEMVRRLRAADDTTAIPVIFFTAHGHADNELEAFRAGGDQFLEKPFHAEQLRVRIERLLRWRKELVERFAGQPDATTDNADPDTGFAGRLRQALERNLDNPDLDVEGLAEQLHISRASLYRRLSDEYKLTPAEFIRGFRLDRAARMLRESDAQVSEIAYATGFKRLSTFTRSFTSRFGMAPTAYRAGTSDATWPTEQN